jgi:hypothetical protein
MYLRLYEAKGLLSKEIQKFCLAMPCDHPEDHMHRCRVGDEEDYERTKMAEISLLYEKWGICLAVVNPPFLGGETADRSRALEARAGLGLPW